MKAICGASTPEATSTMARPNTAGAVAEAPRRPIGSSRSASGRQPSCWKASGIDSRSPCSSSTSPAMKRTWPRRSVIGWPCRATPRRLSP